MTESQAPSHSILWRMGTGFSMIIGLCWLMEVLRVPHVLFGEAAGFTWSRVLLRTFVLLSIWAWMHWTTRRLLNRLHHLEKFLFLCSWCRKLCHEGEWHTIEQYFGSRFETETSHGICPDCAEEQKFVITAGRAVTEPAGEPGHG